MIDDTTPIGSEGELISTYLAPLAEGFPGAYGLKDDCAVAAPRPGCEFVFKTDAIAAGVHFLPDDPPEDIAWKALAVNVSDLAAKAAEPVGYLMSLAFPQAPTHGWMRRFAGGLAEAQAAFGMHLMGGDTDRRPGPLAITPMVVGEVPAGKLIRRDTARVGGKIFVSGCLGDAALGLVLRRDPKSGARWGLGDADAAALVVRYLRPRPALGLRDALRLAAQASMDLSDGLVKDLGRMCRASGCGARVYAECLPVSRSAGKALSAEPDLFTKIVSAGDDYEVLATVHPDLAADFEACAEAAGVAVAEIGVIVAEAGVEVIAIDGHPISFPVTGYDHF